ncbi:hypothetical protein D3C73_1161910 [compost metagenome]
MVDVAPAFSLIVRTHTFHQDLVGVVCRRSDHPYHVASQPLLGQGGDFIQQDVADDVPQPRFTQQFHDLRLFLFGVSVERGRAVFEVEFPLASVPRLQTSHTADGEVDVWVSGEQFFRHVLLVLRACEHVLGFEVQAEDRVTVTTDQHVST